MTTSYLIRDVEPEVGDGGDADGEKPHHELGAVLLGRKTHRRVPVRALGADRGRHGKIVLSWLTRSYREGRKEASTLVL